MKNKVVRVIPANHSTASIKNVFTILLVGENKGKGMVETTIVHLKGTVEERLQQYRDAVGKEWTGHKEQVFSEHEYIEPISLNIGKQKVRTLSPETIEAQKTIDALVVEAKEIMAWSREEAKKPSVTKKQPVEAEV